MILIAIVFNAKSLKGFADDSYARGVITFLISLATMAIAFVLVYQAFFGESSDDRFRRGREIFTGLMGVLGTIVGFYFGTAEAGVEALTMAPLQVSGTTVTTFVSGGVTPYRFTTAVDGAASDESVSQDGWVKGTLVRAPKPSEGVSVSVKDAQGKEASSSTKYLPPTGTPEVPDSSVRQ